MITSKFTNLEGPNLTLRLIEQEDAAYACGLRTNPLYNMHISTVTGTIEDQRRWIEKYKAREAVGQELYYVIERKDGTPCGLVRLYDIEAERFTWGSWVLDENKPRKAALESALLIYEIGFERVGCDHAVFDVRRENTHTIAFHRRFGATEFCSDELNAYFRYARTKYLTDRPKYLEVLNG